mmetsp:Transcript_28002/g.73902  ORF Transcript_28002/g.73902 Transcript_28002/m.73902 type:complete len:204 (+) Transcript_28002:650-1261(+)
MRQCTADDKSAYRMSDKTQTSKRRLWFARAPVPYVELHLVGQPDPHLCYVSLSVLLVRTRTQVQSPGIQQRYVVPDQTHVKRVPLETVHQNENVQALVRQWLDVDGWQASPRISVDAGHSSVFFEALLEQNRLCRPFKLHREVLDRHRRQILEVARFSKRRCQLAVRCPNRTITWYRDINGRAYVPKDALRPTLHHQLLPNVS